VARGARSLRVIAGEAGGRRLVSPPGERVRPTTDRVKESVFSALGPDRLVGARVLDLYAGTGALAIEALSRGAARAVLVERDAAAARAIAANLESTGLAGRALLRRADVRAVVSAPAVEAFDLIFLDPPYDLREPELAAVLERLAAGGWAAATATLVVERSGTATPPIWPSGWRSTWERCYGDTLMLFAQRE
jgi:16S rRNA (guanine966-N2)-methyltransferase